MKPLRISGDSHTSALMWAWGLYKQKWGDVAISAIGNGAYMDQPFFEVHNGTISFTRADYRAFFSKFGTETIGATDGFAYGLVLGFHTVRVFRDPMWRQFAPWSIAKSIGLQPISDAVAIAIIDRDSFYIRSFFAACQKIGVDFFVIAAPPPRRSHPCIANGTNPKVVLAVDKIYRERISAQLTSDGIRHLMPPQNVFDDDGFLATKFEASAAGDGHHANLEYGMLFLSKIMDHYRAWNLAGANSLP